MAQSQKPSKSAGGSKQTAKTKKGGAVKKAEDDRNETLQAVV